MERWTAWTFMDKLTKMIEAYDKDSRGVHPSYYMPHLGFGRTVIKGSVSFASLAREVKQRCLKHTVDCDLANGHPRLLLEVCLKERIGETEYANLKRYVDHRETVLEEVAQACGVSPGEAKTLVLGLCFGMAAENWAARKRVDQRRLPRFQLEFQQEMKDLTKKHLVPKNQQLFDRLLAASKGDRGQALRTLRATACQEWEARVMEGTLYLEGDDECDGYAHCVSEYDGVMFDSSNVKDISELLRLAYVGLGL